MPAMAVGGALPGHPSSNPIIELFPRKPLDFQRSIFMLGPLS
jgi:hypothetical protein